MSSKECTLKAGQLTPLNKTGHSQCHQKSAHLNQANSLAETKQATVTVIRRVHIKDQANSHTETRQATVSVTRRVHIKTRPTHILKQDKPQSLSSKECTLKPSQLTFWTRQAIVTVTRRVQIKTKPTHILKQDMPQSVSPEECTSKTRPTHSLNKTGHS